MQSSKSYEQTFIDGAALLRLQAPSTAVFPFLVSATVLPTLYPRETRSTDSTVFPEFPPWYPSQTETTTASVFASTVVWRCLYFKDVCLQFQRFLYPTLCASFKSDWIRDTMCSSCERSRPITRCGLLESVSPRKTSSCPWQSKFQQLSLVNRSRCKRGKYGVMWTCVRVVTRGKNARDEPWTHTLRGRKKQSDTKL